MEESANNLKGSEPDTREGLGYFRWEILWWLLVQLAYVQAKSFLYAIFTHVLESRQYFHKVHITFLPHKT